MFNTFAAKLDCSRICRSLTNATIVEIKGTVDSCLFLTVIRDANLCSLFQNVEGTKIYHIWKYAQFSGQELTLQKYL